MQAMEDVLINFVGAPKPPKKNKQQQQQQQSQSAAKNNNTPKPETITPKEIPQHRKVDKVDLQYLKIAFNWVDENLRKKEKSPYVLSHFNNSSERLEPIDIDELSTGVYAYHLPGFVDDGKAALASTTVPTKAALTMFKTLVDEIRFKRMEDKHSTILALFGKITTESLCLQLFCKRTVPDMSSQLVSEQIVILATHLKRKICQMMLRPNLPSIDMNIDFTNKIIII